jgi:hypothetical protein
VAKESGRGGRAVGVLVLLVVVALVVAGITRRVRGGQAEPSPPPRAPRATPERPRPVMERPVAAALPLLVLASDGGAGAADARTNAPRVLVNASWGSGPGQLGHERPAEGNPEAPMSLTVDASGNIVVLDQVNGRLVRFGPDGRPLGTVPVPVRAAQDVAVARDGTLAVLDRLGDRRVSLVGPDGRVRADLPIEGANVPEGGGVTAVVVDGDDVYVEREHGPLVRIGDTSGREDRERSEIPGRPSRDGLSYVSAGLVDAATGRFFVNSVERPSLQHRFTREIRLESVLAGIVMLDTDRAGTIYVAVLTHPAGATTEPLPMTVRLLCLDPLQGRPLGQAALPANTSPEETFREMVVLDDGGVLYAVRTDEGVSLERFDCR